MMFSFLQQRAFLAAKILAIAAVFFLPISTSLLQIFLLGMLMFWFLSGDYKDKIQFIWQHSVSKICLLLFGLFVLGSLYSPGSNKDILESLSKMSKILYVPFFLPLMQEEKWRKYALSAFILSMTLSLILGLLKLYFHLPLYLGHASNATVFKSYIDTNLMMALATFILAQLFLKSHSMRIKSGLVGLIVVMTLYILWYSEGRSGYVVFVALWALFCIQNLKLKQSMFGLLGLVLVLGLASVCSEKFQQRLKLIPQEIEQFQQGDSFTSVGQRIEYVAQVLNLSKEHAILGFGTGSFKQVYKHYSEEKGLQKTTNPHNEYLNILFQLGGLGLFVFLSLFGLMYKTSLKLPKLEGQILQGGLVSMGIGCLANSWLMDFTPGYLFIMLTAVCLGAGYEKTNLCDHHHV